MDQAWDNLFGESPHSTLIQNYFLWVLYHCSAAMKLGPVIDFSDAAIFSMALVNIIGLYFLMPVVKAELKSYMSRLKSGEIKRFSGGVSKSGEQ